MASRLLTEMLLFNLPFSSLLPFFKKIIYLFLVTVGLHCCLGFSRVVESWGYSLVSVCGLLVAVACLVVEHRPEEHRLQELWHMGLVALQRVGSSQTRDRTCVPCIGRQILIHCTTREVLSFTSFNLPPLHPHRPTTIGTNHYELQCLVNEVLVYKLYFLFVRKVVLNCYAIWSLIHILNNLSVFSISLDFVYILFSQHLKPFPA